MIVKLTNCGDNTHRYDIPTDHDWFDGLHKYKKIIVKQERVWIKRLFLSTRGFRNDSFQMLFPLRIEKYELRDYFLLHVNLV